MNMKYLTLAVLFVVITLPVHAQQLQSQTQHQSQNHFDPSNRAYERAQKGKHWHKLWKKHYSHKRPKKLWHQQKRQDGLQPFVSAIDYSTRNIYLFNYENDEMITVKQSDIRGWHWDLPLQHTAIQADGRDMWVTSDATVNEPPRIIRLGIKKIDWNNNSAILYVKSVNKVGGIGEPATLPPVSSVDGSSQEVASWIQASMAQVHAPTFLPFSDFMYWTEYTGNKVHVLKNKKQVSRLKETVQIPGWTESTHGIFFNTSGTLGLGTGYFYDNNVIDVYEPNRITGELVTKSQIKLEMMTESGEKFVAPFTHLIDWVDERYAYTVTMQHDRTSLTNNDVDGFIGPSVWLLDAVDMTATKVIDQAMNATEGGIFRSGSDIAVVNNKLYIAEEDSVRQEDVSNARDGYVSVFDITDRKNPVFLKRLEPGIDLPVGYNIAHTLVKTKDNRFVFVFSWHSGWVAKIDTYDDTVAHIYGPDDGLVMPHGGQAAGQIR